MFGRSICELACWAVAGVAGLVAFLATMPATSLIAALLMGVALAAFLGLVLGQLICGVTPATASAAQTPVDTASVAADAARKAPPAPQPAAATPAEAVGAATPPETDIPDYDGDGVKEGTGEGTRPAALDAARDGKADNLKEIKGVGPKLEALLNSLGFYHFDQIAGWTADEIAWVDANLEGFRGRVSRDGWVAQAKILATGGETEFSKRVEDGDVY